MSLPAGVTAVFPFAPDWSNTVDETYEFKTTITRSRNQTPQYRGLRSKPRCSLEYTSLLEGDDAASFDYRLYAVQPYVWMVPQWSRKRFLKVNAMQHATSLSLDAPVSYLAAAGDEYILMAAGKEPEVIILQSISTDRKTLTLSAGLEAAWPARTQIYPAWQMQFSSAVRATKLTDRVLRAPVTLRRLIDDRAPVSSPLVADVTLYDFEVLVRPLNWNDEVNVGYEWVANFIDSEIGDYAYQVLGNHGQRTRKGTVLCDGRDEVDWWLSFFARRSGQRIPFLVPTWQGDLLLQDPVSGADFEVSGTDLGRFMPANQVYPYLMIRKKSGTLGFFPIVTVTPDFDLGVTTITTLTAWDESYGPWECIQACFVAHVHLASDVLKVSWITDEAATIELTVIDEVLQ